jgi:hypothetical protein
MKLGGSPSLAEPFPEKPKGIHWRTYNRLVNEAARHETIFATRMGVWMSKLAQQMPKA